MKNFIPEGYMTLLQAVDWFGVETYPGIWDEKHLPRWEHRIHKVHSTGIAPIKRTDRPSPRTISRREYVPPSTEIDDWSVDENGNPISPYFRFWRVCHDLRQRLYAGKAQAFLLTLDAKIIEVPAECWGIEQIYNSAFWSGQINSRWPALGQNLGSVLFRETDVKSNFQKYTPKNKGGRPSEYDWDSANAKMYAWMAANGTPSPKSQLVKVMAEYFAARGQTPSDSLLREKVYSAVERFQQEMESE